MKAIQTWYNGTHFRSRVEARYALFLHEMGVYYEYESEGFITPSGMAYLPDFWLPDLQCYVEIKSDMPATIDQLEGYCKALDFSTGLPSDRRIYLHKGPANPVLLLLAVSPKKSHWAVLSDWDGHVGLYIYQAELTDEGDVPMDRLLAVSTPRIQLAMSKAKAERFDRRDRR